MKKKILIVFLICCMLLGVASPALANEFVYPNTSDDSFPVSSQWGVNDYFVYKFLNSDDYYWYDAFVYSGCDILFVNDGSSFSVVPVNLSSGATMQLYRYEVKPADPSFGCTWEYKLDESLEELKPVSTSNSSRFFYMDSSKPFYCTYSIYDDSSSWQVFRPAPLTLPELTEELIQKTPGALDLDGKMKILAPFGISCLALLISLPLLLKVLRRFLG